MRRMLNAKQKYMSIIGTYEKCLVLIRTDKWPASQKTTSAPDAFPSRLFDKRSNVQILTAEDRDTWATTPKACPKCENGELKFRDVQTRGADEGSTIFYKCPACGHDVAFVC
jgi:DNA-directed RNA polymerase I subunit RPA12